MTILQHIDHETRKAKASPAGKILSALGYVPWHTGGGLMAWWKWFGGADGLNPSPGDVPIRVITFGDGDLGSTDDAYASGDWHAGYQYWIDGDCLYGGKGDLTLPDAIAWAEAASFASFDQTSEIADKFAEMLKAEIGDEKFAEVRRRNVAHTDDNICASHDFCDANMIMEPAFTAIMKRAPRFGTGDDAAENTDAAIWSAAWDIAKARHLTA